MKIAIASGKGGTGKTTLAVNLALSLKSEVLLLDCDVEAPNTHVFLKGEPIGNRIVTIPSPVVDEAKCNGCGECGDFCAFNAIITFGTVPVISYDMCHGCGGCVRVCPQKALKEFERRIGIIETFQCDRIKLIQGRLDVGGALSPPLIRAVCSEAKSGLAIMDAPPGTSCPVVATVREADYVILVTEPTPFGLNDLRLAVGVMRELSLPFGVVINRMDDAEDKLIEHYLEEEEIPLLAVIPNDRRIAELYAIGKPIFGSLPEYDGIFTGIMKTIHEGA